MSHSETTFEGLGVKPKLLAILNSLKFTTPTPIQAKAIPAALGGKDVVGIAQTGTGKTLAFSIPMVEAITRTGGIGLVVAPTRELAEQIYETLKLICQPLGWRGALLIGGASMTRQIDDVRRQPHVIIGTPGRINDHLRQRTLQLNKVSVLVLDEADRMLDMGFAPQIKDILKHVPKERQTMLFSATMPVEIEAIASQHMREPVRIQVANPGQVAGKVVQELFVVDKHNKNQLLDALLTQYKGTVLVFSRTKYGAKKICRSIRDMHHDAAEIHSNLSPSQRRNALAGFKSGAHRVLVATDIASRGIDVSDIELVINYDLPDHLEDYVHRVGRTGRAGKTGKAVSFVEPAQRSVVRQLERLVGQTLTISPLPILPPHRATSHHAPASHHSSGGHRSHSAPSASRHRRTGSGAGPKKHHKSSSRRVRTHY